MTDLTRKCPGCPGQRTHGQELCNQCWRILPASTCGRLARNDARATLRRHQLRQALKCRTPLAIIRVVP
ncbi:hypothetical protein PV728_29375 [Streptomyces europaeiscabiei]|uniref:hypothetical protein n=1 Tax=Streptomyces europaeiscabiei TaxID=146819 RepID=UPI0029B333A6|nr:hypothetical protein [Streptomyces europaeiscabiei]MDX3634302.1 hypothetical protein [Streptomyces europaeiscabiei]MDX3651850.1 hypothetical protein [Streptomyces europaeiscabiei]